MEGERGTGLGRTFIRVSFFMFGYSFFMRVSLSIVWFTLLIGCINSSHSISYDIFIQILLFYVFSVVGYRSVRLCILIDSVRTWV